MTNLGDGLAFAFEQDAGKSSLLGVLTKSKLDDGRGRARISLFRHKHEIETGRTSSAGNEILGFTPDSLVIVPDEHGSQQAKWEAIAAKAGKVVSFTDLAGHERSGVSRHTISCFAKKLKALRIAGTSRQPWPG